MEWIDSILKWFSGGSTQYHNLLHCMRGDTFWIALTVFLDLGVATGYMLIARHWAANQRRLKSARMRVALGRMRNIFIFCGICGYLFIPVKIFWPAWRLYDLFLLVLVYLTWRYALDSRDLEVVYTELNRSQELAENLRATREESRRKTQFLNAVSHDLRTPLNGLVLQMDLASMNLEAGQAEEARQSLVQARLSAQEAANMLGEFLELAKLDWTQEAVPTSEFNARAVAQQTVEQFASEAATKGLELRLQGGSPLLIKADPQGLRRILNNLLSNAIKFTASGTVVVELQRQAGNFSMSVIDTGLGISSENQARIFDEFFQVHNYERDRSKGFGLGLAIARRLAARMGGELMCESVEGRGSRFTLLLHHVVVDHQNAGRRGAREDDGSGGKPAETAAG